MKLMVYFLLVTWIWDLGDCIFLITYVNGLCGYRYQHLKLYPEDEYGPQSMKKPVVVESYNEIVFPEPSEVFLARVQNHPAVNVPRLPAGLNLSCSVPSDVVNDMERGDTKDHPLTQWFLNFSEDDEILKLAAARQQMLCYSAFFCSLK
ncbi:Transcription initiation factor TFIID subunit 14b [Glycine soja]